MPGHKTIRIRPHRPKELAINQRMQMKEDDKVPLKLENGDTECVLLKHGPPAAMNAEFEKFSEIYSAFFEQSVRDLLSTPTSGTRWTSSATGTPENISQTPGTLLRVILVLYWSRLVKLELLETSAQKGNYLMKFFFDSKSFKNICHYRGALNGILFLKAVSM